MMTPTDLAQYRATYDPDSWRASLAADPSPDGRTQLIVGAALAVRALCTEVERLNAVRAPAPSPAFDDLAFACQVAPGLEWQDGVAYAWAELPTGRAVSADGYASISRWSIIVAVGGYKLRRNLARPLTVAEARHVLHDHAQRLARSTLDYRRAAGMAILVGMGEV